MTLRKTTKLETEVLLKRYISHQKTPALSATGQGGLKLFVDDLKRRLHLPLILNGFSDKLWGYKLAALVLVLLCRPQLGANSIAALREKLLCRFICRLFYIRWESNAAEKRPKRLGVNRSAVLAGTIHSAASVVSRLARFPPRPDLISTRTIRKCLSRGSSRRETNSLAHLAQDIPLLATPVAHQSQAGKSRTEKKPGTRLGHNGAVPTLTSDALGR